MDVLLGAVLLALFNVNYLVLMMSVAVPPRTAARTQVPTFSVLIANVDQAAVVERTLRAVRDAAYPQRRVEIILVDGTGNPAMRRIARKHRARLLRDRKEGKGNALNLGLLKARHGIVYILDSDTRIERNAFREIAASISSDSPVVSGIFIPANRAGFTSLLARLELVCLNLSSYWNSRVLGTTGIGGRNFAVYRKTLLEIGGFTNVLTEDIDFSRRLYNRKVRIHFNPNVISTELVPVRLSHMWRQHERWARGGMNEILRSFSNLPFIFVFPFLITAMLFHVFLPVLGAVYLLTGNVFALTGMLLALALALYQAWRYLSPLEVVLLPVVVTALSVFLMLVCAAAIAKAALGLKTEWYTTPKSLD